MYDYDGHVALFFFQAEDGIRDVAVTGVQTCALPICLQSPRRTCHLSSCKRRAAVSLPPSRTWRKLAGRDSRSPPDHARGTPERPNGFCQCTVATLLFLGRESSPPAHCSQGQNRDTPRHRVHVMPPI